MKRTYFVLLKCIGLTLLVVCLSFFIALFLMGKESYPMGFDTFYQLYRGDILYKSITENGNFFLCVSQAINNGVEFWRFEAPLCGYLLAFMEWMAFGDVFRAYLLFVVFIFWTGVISWTYVGARTGLPYRGALLGMLWFFLPNNLMFLFGEGDLPKSLFLALLPVFFFHVQRFLLSMRIRHSVALSLWMGLLILTDRDASIMVTLAALIYIIALSISRRSYLPGFRGILSIFFGYLLVVFWLVPNLSGFQVDRTELMENYFQKLLLSVNPFLRMENHSYGFYFGLALVVLGLFGFFLSRKSTRPGFGVAMLLLLLSAEGLYPLVSILPGKQYLFMLQYISIAAAIIFFEFTRWQSLKKGLVLVFLLALLVDSIPSAMLVYENENKYLKAEEELKLQEEKLLLNQAKAITKQRLGIFVNSLDSTSYSYILADMDIPTHFTGGVGWEESELAENIRQMNRAYDQQSYLYLFDRAREFGDDSILIYVQDVDSANGSLEVAANQCGYERVAEEDGLYLYHLKDVTGNFGTVSEYSAIAIGSGCKSIALDFPAFEETSDTCLDHYSLEELSSYELIYLSGFTYEDKAKAEKLVKDLSESGVRIVIAADGIPEDKLDHNQSFLGVICNGITFSQGYPLLQTIDGELDCDLFPQGHTNWATVYMDGLDDVWGYVKENDYEIPFYGTAVNENIVVVGINLTYYYSLTKDEGVGKLLGHAMAMDKDNLAKRRLVELQVEEESDALIIHSPEDGVNTGYAYLDCYVTKDDTQKENHYLVVNEGRSKLRYCPTWYYKYAMINIMIVCLWIGTLILMYQGVHGRKKKQEGAGSVE